jgi:hypothetical protein
MDYPRLFLIKRLPKHILHFGRCLSRGMATDHEDMRFATKAVHSGMIDVEGSATTPIFRTSTYRLTDEKYKGWAEGLHHTVV